MLKCNQGVNPYIRSSVSVNVFYKHPPFTKVKPGRARLALGWVTTWEYPVSPAPFYLWCMISAEVVYQRSGNVHLLHSNNPRVHQVSTLQHNVGQICDSTAHFGTQCPITGMKVITWKLDFVLSDASTEFAWSDFVPHRCEQVSWQLRQRPWDSFFPSLRREPNRVVHFQLPVFHRREHEPASKKSS